jgi:ArsR family transcriptional regulator, arsenate/arsenite/antimonite-responsive transcriptional repressor
MRLYEYSVELQELPRMKELERYFKALADSNRLRILNLLLHGELCVCDIQYVLQASQPNVSRHLSYLKNSGLVLDRRDGPRIFYRLAAPMERNKKRLFGFFQDASKGEKQLRSDKKRLKEAVAAGACTLSEWKPFSAIIRSKDLQART